MAGFAHDPPIAPTHTTRRRMVLTLALVWLAWFVANLAANGLSYIAAHDAPDLRLPAEILYYFGVSITGVVVPYHLCRTWGLDTPLFPQKRTPWFWIGSVLFLILAVPLGITAMSDQGVTLSDAFSHSLDWILAPMPIFIPTMIAYTLLWYGLMLRGWERILGSSRWATVLAIVLSAVMYGVYHLASVNEIATLAAMADEIFITTLIGIGFGVYVVLARSLLVAFLINWLLNWFVFTPLDTFHPPVWQWPIALLVLTGVWLLYRYGWIESS
jgi:membrane protease YdiL (CAAX protease family)